MSNIWRGWSWPIQVLWKNLTINHAQEHELHCHPHSLCNALSWKGKSYVVCLTISQLQYFNISPKLHFRFPVEKDPQLYIICVDGVPRLNTCAAGSLFDKATLGCVEQQTDFWLFRMQHVNLQTCTHEVAHYCSI